MQITSAVNTPGLQPLGSEIARSSTLKMSETDKESQRRLRLLTPSDREFVQATTGERLDENSALGPILAFQISEDRASGVLQAGQSIDINYVKGLLERFKSLGVGSGGSGLFTDDQLKAAMDYLQNNSGKATSDFYA